MKQVIAIVIGIMLSVGLYVVSNVVTDMDNVSSVELVVND